MRTKRILFFFPSFNISINQIQQAVSLEYASFLYSLGYECLYLATEGDLDLCRQTEQMIKDRYNIKALIAQHQTINIPFLSKWRASKVAFKRKEKEIMSFNPTHIFTSSSIDFIEAKRLSKRNGCRCIHLIEGVIPEEALLSKGRKGIYYWLLKYLEIKVIKHADAVILVSNKMKIWYEKKLTQKSYVIPCCKPGKSENSIGEILDRQSLGFEKSNKVICYLGGLSKWQRIDDIVALFNQIYCLDDNFRFLFVVREQNLLNEKLREAKLNPMSYHVTSCKSSEVEGVLNLADAGIIMRHDIIVNNVASPLKFSEYLASGLPVILTDNIGDMSGLIDHDKVGCVLEESFRDASNVIEYVNALDKEQIQESCRAFVKKYLSWAAYENEFHDFMN